MKKDGEMKIYLDTCCYGRPYDEVRHSQERVETEVEIILDVVGLCKALGFPILGSITLKNEIYAISDAQKRRDIVMFYNYAVSEHVKMTNDIFCKAQELNVPGMKKGDPFHAAHAEAANAMFLLTTDAKFESAAAKLNLSVKVITPINFLPEVERWKRLLT